MSREDAAFFVYDEGSLLVWKSEDESVRVYKNGSMRIHYTEPSGEVSVLRYTSDLDDKGLDSDEKLRAAEESGKIEWWENPWFEVVTPDNEDGEVTDDFTSSIEYAKTLVR